MSPALRGFVDKPQQVWARRAMYQIHLWSGLVLGVYILLISITGVALVFRDELAEMGQRHLVKVEEAVVPSARIAPDDVRRLIAAKVPDEKLYSLWLPEDEHGTYMAYTEKNKVYTAHYFHPQTGAYLGVVRTEGNFLRWLQLLHFNLLSGTTGRVVNGVGGLFLFLLCLTGLPIWWQGIKRWRRGLNVAWKTSWKRVNWDLHSATGIYTLVFSVLWGLTGAYFAFPNATRSLVGLVLPVTPPAAPAKGKPKKVREVAAPSVPVATVAAKALAASPGHRLRGFIFLDPMYVQVMPASADPHDYKQIATLYFDPSNGDFIRADLPGSQKTGDRLIRWFGPLHFGNFGGVTVKILWMIIGLAPGVLAVSGTLMWWNRSGSKKVAKWKTARTRKPFASRPVPAAALPAFRQGNTSI